MLNREQYLLTKAAEECNEVSQILLKTQQFGMNERRENKTDEPTNRERIHAEINDLLAVVDLLNEEAELNYNRHDPWNAEQIAKKKERIQHWYNYSVSVGRVEKPVAPAVALTGGGDPTDPSYKELKDNGQQKEYLVLSDEERAKGFIRPVRTSYVHKKCHALTRMSLEIAETYARNPKFYGATFCVGCKTHLPVDQFVWDGTDELVGS